MEIDVPIKQFTTTAHPDQIAILKDFDNGIARFYMCNWHRRARKSTLAINLLIRECCRHPRRRYGYITSTFIAAKNIIWRDPNMISKWLPDGVVSKKNESELYVEFKNGSILSIHGADKPDSIRGCDFSGVVLDESPLIKRETWEEILRPIIAQSKDRWAVFIFTPKGRASWIYEMWANAKNNPDFARYLLTADQSGIIPKEELEKLKKELPQRVYAQEMMGDFTESASSVFKNIELCIGGELEPFKQGYSYVTAIDLAKVEDFSVILTICRETKKVVAFERFNTIDWSVQKERILAHCHRYSSFAVVDATGLGDPIAEDLHRQGLSVLPFKISSSSKQELIERLMVAIEQRLITFPKIPELIDELGIFSYEISDHGNVRFAAPEGSHDDCVMALALAVYGLKSYMYGKKERKPMAKSHEQQSNAGIGF
jgi:hypothetical protein